MRQYETEVWVHGGYGYETETIIVDDGAAPSLSLLPLVASSPRVEGLRFKWDMSFPSTVAMSRCRAGDHTIAYRPRGRQVPWKFSIFKCGSWRCARCANWDAKRTLEGIKAGLCAGSWRIARLSRPSCPGDAYVESARQWHRLHAAMRKHASARVYLIVTSRTPSGLRLTLVADSLPPRSSFARLAARAGFHVDHVGTVSIAGVLSALKPELRDRSRLPLPAPLRFRRIRASRSLKLKKISHYEGRVLKEKLSVVYDAALKAESCGIPFDISQFPSLKS